MNIEQQNVPIIVLVNHIKMGPPHFIIILSSYHENTIIGHVLLEKGMQNKKIRQMNC